MRTPRELIELYWERVWNRREAELIREICADPIIRHDPNSVTALSHDEQVNRVRQQSAEMEPFFTHEVLLADDTYVTSVWNMHTRKGERIELCGMEVFKAENGRFTDCWNSTYSPGRWGREGDTSVPHDLPPPALLSSVEQIDTHWIQRVLRHAGLDVPRVGLVRTKPIGQGNVSSTVKVRVDYNADAGDAPRTLIAKFHSQVPEANALVARYGIYRREAAIYTLFGAEPPLRTPRVYLAKVAPDGMSINLVLEDLSERCRLGDQISGCGTEEARAVIDELAGLHLRYLNAPELDMIDWGGERPFADGLAAETYAAGAAIYRERFAGRLDPEEFALIDAFVPLVGSWAAARPAHRTLVHRDPRVDNVLFETGVDGALAAYLIDWQCAGIGDPQFDLAYFLTGSLSPEDRRRCERDLIQRHAARLREVDASYTDEAALEAYRRNAVSGLQATVAAAVAIPSTPATDQLLLALVRRNCAAVADWRSLEALGA
jgi:hypothetical protein